jgi:hypothetical protein
MKKLNLFIVAAMMIGLPSIGQTAYQVGVDSKGKIKSGLPEKLLPTDTLVFKTTDHTENFDKYTSRYIKQVTAAKENLENLIKNKTDVYVMIKSLYGITDTEITAVLQQMDAVIRDPFANASAEKYLPYFVSADEAYYGVEFTNLKTPANKKFSPEKSSGNINIALLEKEKKLEFTIKATDPYKSKVCNWLSKTKDMYDPETLNKSDVRDQARQFTPLLKSITAFLKRANMFLDDGTNTNTRRDMSAGITKQERSRLIGIADSAKKYIELVKPFDNNGNRLASYKNWLLHWLWYQSGTPVLNPFPFRRPGDITDTSSLSGLRIAISTRENLMATEKFLTTVRLTFLDSLISQTDSLKKEMFTIQKAYRIDSTLSITNAASIKNFGQTSSVMNRGILFVQSGDDNTAYYMRHHDADNNNQLMSPDTKDNYTEDDRVVILEHNLLQNEDATAQLTLVNILNDESVISEVMRSVIAEIAATMNLTKSAGVGQHSTSDPDEIILNKAINNLSRLGGITQRIVNYQNYILSQDDPYLSIKETTDEASGYHSKVLAPAKKNNGPKKGTYTITKTPAPPIGTSTSIPDTFTYRINKLYHLFPMAGLNYSLTQFNDVTYNAEKNTFTNTQQSQARFVIGIKVFLRKTDIRNTKFLLQRDENGRRFFLSRTSVTVAFDAAKPQDNYYAGLGLDLWPGFCVNTGVVFNRYVYNQFTDGVNIKSQTLYRPGIYLGVSTDVSLFTDIVKLLNFYK